MSANATVTQDVETTLIYTGRPLRVRRTDYVADWNTNRQAEIKALTSKGVIPHDEELKSHPEKSLQGRMWLCVFYFSLSLNPLLPPLFPSLPYPLKDSSS